MNIQIVSLDSQIDRAVYELGVYPAYNLTVGGRLTSNCPDRLAPKYSGRGLAGAGKERFTPLYGVLRSKEEEIGIVEGSAT